MYLDSKRKSECTGCEACGQICPKKAIEFTVDSEGFSYPHINSEKCIHCNLCRKVCPFDNDNLFHRDEKFAFGGYILDEQVKFESTSGGAFSAIAKAFCDKNYVVFGAESHGIDVFHSYITDIKDLQKYRKSKYAQSKIGDSYKLVKQFLREGKKVLFSGTPCQIAGLRDYLSGVDLNLLLTVEVVCEGVPSPLYIEKMEKKLKEKYRCEVEYIDYRCKGKLVTKNRKTNLDRPQLKQKRLFKTKWDFEIMEISMSNKKTLRWDRWFNPFWSIWLQHLMSRPSCYACKYAKQDRVADITLGDLWGVHKYCPELYGKNGGSSLVICNTNIGGAVFNEAKKFMFGHELDFKEALKYQSPLRKHIDSNANREKFINDLKTDISYDDINKKWAKKASLKLLWQKYIWGNRQKVVFWNVIHRRNKK